MCSLLIKKTLQIPIALVNIYAGEGVGLGNIRSFSTFYENNIDKKTEK